MEGGHPIELKKVTGPFACAKKTQVTSKLSIPSLARPHAAHGIVVVVVAAVVVVDVTIVAIEFVGIIGVVGVNRRRPPSTRNCTRPKAALVCGIWASIDYYRANKFHGRAPVGKSDTLSNSVKLEILVTDLNSFLPYFVAVRQGFSCFVESLCWAHASVPIWTMLDFVL